MVSHAIHQYVKANNKCMKDYDKKRTSYLKYWDLNKWYGWAISQKLPVNDFKWVEIESQFNEGFIKGCNEDSNEGHFFEDDVQYPERLHDLLNELPFLPDRKKIEKVENLVANLNNKKEYVIHIKNLKQTLNHWLFLIKYIEPLNFIKNLV